MIAGNQGRVGALREPLPCWSAFTEGHITTTASSPHAASTPATGG